MLNGFHQASVFKKHELLFLDSPVYFWWVRGAHLCLLLCCFTCIACLCPVSFVPNIASGSGFLFLIAASIFSNVYSH